MLLISLPSVSNFSNQLRYCTSRIPLWLKGWMNWWLTQYEWVTIRAIFVHGCVSVFVFVPAQWPCLPCQWVRVCNWICRQRWGHDSDHTHTASAGLSLKVAVRCDFDPYRRIRFPIQTQRCRYSSGALACPSGDLPRTPVTLLGSSNRAQCAFKHKGSSCWNWTLGVQKPDLEPADGLQCIKRWLWSVSQ